MQAKTLIIGITGAFGSGKTTAAQYFKSKGFLKITLSFFLEKEVRRRGFKKITRQTLQDIGNEWREKYGRGILARKTLKYLKKIKVKKAVIDGIRNVGEIEEFRKRSENFILLAMVADRKIRFERLKKLKKRELLTPKIFEKLDMRDLGIGEKSAGLQVAYCMAVADVFLTNNQTKKEFIIKLERLYEKL